MRNTHPRTYTSWTLRCAAWLIDMIPLVVAFSVWEIVAITNTAMDCVTHDNGGVTCSSTGPPGGGVVPALLVAAAVGYLLWNNVYRQGRRGASVGKSVCKIRLVSEKTWQPIGFGASLLRQVLHLVDMLCCFLGFLFPLWDAKRQTLADKLMGTVCVPGIR